MFPQSWWIFINFSQTTQNLAYTMGNCCASKDKAKVEFDNIDKDKSETSAKLKNNYSKDPTNLPATNDAGRAGQFSGWFSLFFVVNIHLL